MKERLRFELGFLEIGRKREPGESAMRVILDHKSDDPASMVMSEAGVPQSLSPWNHSRGKRMFDFVAAGVVLLPCLPLMALIAAAVAVTSRGPVLFRQRRVGENERAIELLKFRTMLHNLGSAGPGVTRSGDPRITPIGRFLRRCKLDELPQLLNVLRGDMSLVGPRPDLEEFCQALGPEHRLVLTLRPGLTGWATLHFRNEEQLLAAVPKEQLVSYYRETILPQKAQLDMAYAERATFLGDLAILGGTFLTLFR
ncbi:MAG TPA: sugar transferase [Terriglobales bacterium]|nr:sugar transferase [Terriglobales bacterium]